MKKLLLTSNGLSSRKIKKEFLRLLDKPAAENKVLIMHTGKPRSNYYLKLLSSLGLLKKNILFADISKQINPYKFKDIDIFYSRGGNTYYILSRVKKTGFDKYIKSFVKQGKLYIGLSAGSMIIHKTIEFAGWGKEADKNEIGLRDLNGLDITNIAIFPHFKYKLKKELALFKKNTPYPLVELKDRQALEIIGNKTRKIL